jgi:FKBP-type peptidyl-prolyl cis-trans isomerase
MRIVPFVTLALLSAATLSAQQPRTSVATAPPDVKAPPADAQKTASGLASKVITPGTGKTHPGPTDVVTVHFTGWKTDGSMFDSSVLRGKPAMFTLNRVIAGWAEGLQLMVEGEKRRLWIPESLAYKGQREPKGMLVLDVELLSFVSTVAPADVKAAPADATKTPSGLAYRVLKPGTGTKHPTAASTVTVHYTGWTTDGKMFDSSVTRGMPVSFGLGDVIKGWTEGVQLMVQGEKARFWIPQELAYQGKQAPYGMLVFDIELLDMK